MTIGFMSVSDFDDLPKVEGMPQGCAWGVFDRDDQKDVLGTLNFLTPDVVRAAAAEVRSGISISLNWPLNALAKTGFSARKPPRHTVTYLPETMGLIAEGSSSWDDELDFNTQISSQWDSLCHVQHVPTGLSYNGSRPDKETLAKASNNENALPTLDQWHTRGALVGRGVLLDYRAYCQQVGHTFSPLDGISITVRDLEACAAHFDIQFRYGDILLLRTGGTEPFESPTQEESERMARGDARSSGLESSVEMARWLWNKRFAAVAADNFALEAIPATKGDGTPWTMKDLVLHPYLLSLFGMPIGELWDLCKLSRYCNEAKRYSFMITSVPLNHPCLVGSPPNAVAIL